MEYHIHCQSITLDRGKHLNCASSRSPGQFVSPRWNFPSAAQGCLDTLVGYESRCQRPFWGEKACRHATGAAEGCPPANGQQRYADPLIKETARINTPSQVSTFLLASSRVCRTTILGANLKLA